MDARERNRRRRYGQNDLRDGAVVERILSFVDRAGTITGSSFLEIGPGLGSLTLPLLARKPRDYVGLEIDPDRARELGTGIEIHRVVVGDATSAETVGGALAGLPEPRRVLGSLPYNVATRIIDALLVARRGTSPRPTSATDSRGWVDAHVVVQAEVAERLAAGPREEAYGFLSVTTQLRAQVSALMRIAPSAFRPQPNVTSVLVRLQPIPQDPLLDWAALRAFLAAAFRARRKTLANSLGTSADAARLGSWFARRGLPPSVRAEELSPADLVDLFAALIIGA